MTMGETQRCLWDFFLLGRARLVPKRVCMRKRSTLLMALARASEDCVLRRYLRGINCCNSQTKDTNGEGLSERSFAAPVGHQYRAQMTVRSLIQISHA